MASYELPIRPLGSQGLRSSAQGLGCMGMSFGYLDKTGNMGSEQESLATLEEALALGATHLDTSDAYGPHTNEQLLSKVLKGRRDKFMVATKFGIQIKDGNMCVNGSPQYVRQAVEASLQRLGIDTIDLYYLHRVDPKTPIEETVKAMSELVKEGKIRYLGLSEVSPEDLRKAHAVHPITAVQLEWSLWTRDAERDVVPVCRELGIGIVAYSPLGRGFLTGQISSPDDLSENDRRRSAPRFAKENFDKNMALVEKVKQIAARHNATAGQLALAWVHAQGEDVFPIPGTKRVKYLRENVAAFNIKLTPEELKEIDDVFPEHAVAGARYNPEILASTYNHYHKQRA